MGKWFGLAVAAALCLPQTANADNGPLSAADSDPVKMGWMQGFPPPPEKQVKFDDASHYTFPSTRWSFAHFREVVPTAVISRGKGPVTPLPMALRPEIASLTFVPTGQTRRVNWIEAFDGAYGDAVLVLHRGRIVYEKYNGVMNRDQPHIAFSVTKSFYGTIAEMLIHDGLLDENRTVASYIPELSTSGFGDATVREVLDMTTGLDYNEDYANSQAKIWAFAVAVGVLPAARDYAGPRTAYDYLKTVAKVGEHGKRFDYQSVDTEVLGWLIARVTGKRSDKVLSERIFSKLGAEHDGDMVIDRAGTPFAAGGLNLTLRDLARFGEMMRLNGRYNGQQIVPAAVVAKIRAGANREKFKAANYTTMPGWSYKSQWWITHDDHGAYMARGIHGQAIWVDPKAEMVVVRFMSNPVASTTRFDNITLPAFRALADHLMTTTPRRGPSSRR